MWYLLDKNKKPIPATLQEVMIKRENDLDLRQVGYAEIDGVRISTIFLGLDHGWSDEPDHQPVLWETMVFGGYYDDYQERYTSHQDAIEGHQKMLSKIRSVSQTDSPVLDDEK